MLVLGLLLGLAIPVVAWAGWIVWERYSGKTIADRPTNPLGEYVQVLVPDPLEPPEPAHVIYLNREGAHLRGGTDDAEHNVSSIVERAGLAETEIPAFAGSNARWNQILGCVRDRFKDFDVRIVDQRPVDEDYVMVVVGGTPEVLDGGDGDVGDGHEGHSHDSATGLAPFNGQVIEGAVVLVFSHKLHEDARRTCETAGMEVAHAFGLDHAMHCGEIMSYLRPCGRRYFRDEDLPCGEHEARKCDRSTGTTQNSHRKLMAVWGPARETAD